MPTPTEKVPYSSTDPNPLGVNMLIRSLITSGVIRDPDHPDTSKPLPARINVFAEMGSAWSQVMSDPNQAQHYIGKLLKYLGADNIVWGTDCILSGSPQMQIEAFKAFSITEQYQEMYGYPAITDDMKRKIFGLNAAKIYHVDPTSARCKVDASSFGDAQARARRRARTAPLDGEAAARPADPARVPRPRTRAAGARASRAERAGAGRAPRRAEGPVVSKLTIGPGSVVSKLTIGRVLAVVAGLLGIGCSSSSTAPPEKSDADDHMVDDGRRWRRRPAAAGLRHTSLRTVPSGTTS